MKIIVIENCTQCPFLSRTLGTTVFCEKIDDGKLIGAYNGKPECPIPNWCPLDDIAESALQKIWGKWPGDESIDELSEQLQELVDWGPPGANEEESE